MSSRLLQDDSFGPQFGAQFDFTLAFEHAILSIVPSTILIVASPFLLTHYVRRPILIRQGWLLWSKMLAATLLAACELCNLLLWILLPVHHSPLALAAAALAFAASLGVLGVLVLEHRHSLRPSAFFTLYITLSLLFDVVQSRSYLSRHHKGLRDIAAVSLLSVSLKFIILVLEEVPKRISDKELRGSVGNEARSGFWNRSLFIWLNRTLFVGFRSFLTVEDLEPLDPEFSSSRVSQKFSAVWAKTNKTSKYCLLQACIRTLVRPVLGGVIPRLCFTAFTFSQPLLLQRVTNFVRDNDSSKQARNGLIGATVLIYLGLAITRGIYTHANYRVVTLLRGILVSEVFKKTMALDHKEVRKGDALTLMSADIDGITLGLPEFHNIWSSVIEVALGILLLTYVVGRASFLVVFPLTISALVGFLMGRKMSPAVKQWNERIQTRVSKTSNVLKQFKSIKLLGLESSVAHQIQALREDETKASRKHRMLRSCVTVTATFAPTLTPAIVIAGGLFWTTFTDGLTPSKAFTALAIIVLISDPLITLLLGYSALISTFACITRVQEYLLLDEFFDGRQHHHPENATNGSCTHMVNKPGLKNGGLCKVPAVAFSNVAIWSLDQGSHLFNESSFTVEPSTITMVVGPTGSGKSTLLRSMLGETRFTGTISVNVPLIAYCAQAPWIQNISIRDNIVGKTAFDSLWYKAVVDACLLDDDFVQLPRGDLSRAGSNGVNLSGGQKHRISLARAIYSRAPLLLIDDVLSALDRTTTIAMLTKLLGPSGLLRRSSSTVVMVTHSVEHVHLARQVLVLDGDGHITKTSNPDMRMLQHYVDSHTNGQQGIETREGESMSLSSVRASSPEDLNGSPSKADIRKRQNGSWATYTFYFGSSRKRLLIPALLLIILIPVTEKAPDIYMRIWLETNPNNNRYFIGFAVLSCATFFSATASALVYYGRVIPASANWLHLKLLKSVFGATFAFHSSTDIGAIINRFSQDMTLVVQTLPSISLQVVYIFSLLVIELGVILAGATYAAAILPILVPLVYFVQHYYLRTSRQMRLLDLESKTPLFTQLSETASGLDHIRGLCWQQAMFIQSLDHLDYSQKPVYYMFCIQRWLGLVMDMMVLILAVVLVSLALTVQNSTSGPAIGLSMTSLITFSSVVIMFVEKWAALETSLGAVSRTRTFIEDTPNEFSPTLVKPLPSWPSHGNISIDRVSVTYNSSETPALRDVSLTIPAGCKAGLIGRTGSGKTSLILALLRLVDYTGTILIDGVDISTLLPQELRSRITTIAQDPVELEGTVRFNLMAFTMGNPDDTSQDSSIVAVLIRVGLWDVIVRHGGLDAAMLELNLSHGQKQLFAIARAILHNRETGSRVVIMDEATSNIDHETDAQIQKIMTQAFRQCTVLVVAHRPTTIQDADVVAELAEGRLISTRSRDRR